MKKVQKKKKVNIERKLFFMVILLLLFSVIGGTFAWYLYGQKQEADTKDIEIMSPYFLYLLNPGDSKSLQFSVGNIHPGEVKQVVICVSNSRPQDVTGELIDIAKESDFRYDLEFICTENLPLDYKVYELTKKAYDSSQTLPPESILIENIEDFYWMRRVGADGTTVTDLMGENVSDMRWEAVFGNLQKNILNAIQNKGQYILFQKDAIGEELHLTYQNGQYDYDYYLIEMTWKENANFSENAKETDLLYVVVNAKQPEPTLEDE